MELGSVGTGTPRSNKIILLLLLWSLSLFYSSPRWVVSAQEPDPAQIDAAVEAIFSQLTPSERVGQLFMVSFQGANIRAEADIGRLIQQFRVGGVYLSAENDNFRNRLTTPNQILALTNNLQAVAQSATPLTSTTELSPTAEADTSYTPLPLFIAINHEGDGYPGSEIHAGLAPVPSQMALGATWNPENVRAVGQLVGHDLSRLGINMLFGPSLDVLDNPRLDQDNLLGTRTFGGHPFWVGHMGRAYIQGLHEGSNGQLLAIAKHFPGVGSSDRVINQEVPTIIKSLDDLRRIELFPFFQVTQIDPQNPGNTVDGLMTAHVRYRGLQGNVPISLDARNLPQLLAQEELAPWRDAGGLVVSAPLGVPAALEGIAAGSNVYPARRLTQDAFLAGSDILLVTDFALGEDPEAELQNLEDAILFFRDKYRNDPNFQTAVDRSVRRILRAKVRLFGLDLPNTSVQLSLENLDTLAAVPVDLNRIAQAGVTLITPNAILPDPPLPGDDILIFTDDRLVRDCAACPEFRLIETDALEANLLRLYGPEATGQISPGQIQSQSFADVKNLLTVADEARAEETASLIAAADWIIFAMLDVNTDAYPQSDAVRALLRSRFDNLRNKRLMLFAFNAPYFLGETEISQLTAYYAFYSKTPPYLEAAARLLFQQFEPAGASPVEIPAIGPLDLSPDPNQVVQLEPVEKISVSGNPIALAEVQAVGSTIDLAVGESIRIRTAVITDRNGNPVPDGTVVNFLRSYPRENLPLAQLPATTAQGLAEVVITKEIDSPLLITAVSGLASQSETINIGPGIVDTPTPTTTPTATPTLMPTATEPTPTETPLPTATVPFLSAPTLLRPPPPSNPVSFVDLVYSLMGALAIAGIAFALGEDRFALEERVRAALVALAAGLVGYIAFTIVGITFTEVEFVGNMARESINGHWVAPLVTIAFAIIGVLLWHLKPGRVFWRKIG